MIVPFLLLLACGGRGRDATITAAPAESERVFKTPSEALPRLRLGPVIVGPAHSPGTRQRR